MAHWSQWFNMDTPSKGNGDFETLDRIQEYQSVCPASYQVAGAQCQVVGSNTTFDYSTAWQATGDSLVQPCTIHGLVCLNTMQTLKLCQDYQVRFRCQEREGSGDSGSRGSQFLLDSRIYLIFLAVPIIIFFIRIFWVFVYKKRCQQRQRRNEGRRVSNGSYVSESSDDNDNASVTSSLAQPPPSYSDLFGARHDARVFSISHGSLVRQCSKCQHYVELGARSLVWNTAFVAEDERGDSLSSGGNAATVPGGRLQAGDPSVQSHRDQCGCQLHDPASDVFEMDQGVVSGGNQPSTLVACRESGPPGCSHLPCQHGGATVAPQPRLHPAQLAAPDTCTCACHEFLVPSGGCDNLGFVWDPVWDPPTGGAGGFPRSGLHVTRFPFGRVESDTSFKSVTDSLPDYDQALEILEKGHEDGQGASRDGGV